MKWLVLLFSLAAVVYSIPVDSVSGGPALLRPVGVVYILDVISPPKGIQNFEDESSNFIPGSSNGYERHNYLLLRPFLSINEEDATTIEAKEESSEESESVEAHTVENREAVTLEVEEVVEAAAAEEDSEEEAVLEGVADLEGGGGKGGGFGGGGGKEGGFSGGLEGGNGGGSIGGGDDMEEEKEVGLVEAMEAEVDLVEVMEAEADLVVEAMEAVADKEVMEAVNMEVVVLQLQHRHQLKQLHLLDPVDTDHTEDRMEPSASFRLRKKNLNVNKKMYRNIEFYLKKFHNNVEFIFIQVHVLYHPTQPPSPSRTMIRRTTTDNKQWLTMNEERQAKTNI
ncbi:hypothetical protein NQ317_019591 [Molorchus minor]|uniref:Uncharacterized protein n=1 Tax=Molorchus minor TaxID=1323400 RepID=A0ABQ9ISP8_9CUCU|nr:hypothetical protein NQ317_019591 [Molorchus minor]